MKKKENMRKEIKEKSCGEMLLACEREMRKLQTALNLARKQRDNLQKIMSNVWLITDYCYWHGHTGKQRKEHWIVVKNKKTRKEKRLKNGSEIIIVKSK